MNKVMLKLRHQLIPSIQTRGGTHPAIWEYSPHTIVLFRHADRHGSHVLSCDVPAQQQTCLSASLSCTMLPNVKPAVPAALAMPRGAR